jgi:phospholipase D-like protein
MTPEFAPSGITGKLTALSLLWGENMPLFGAGAFGVIVMALWIFCLVDVITSIEGTTRNLPKMGWIFVVLLLPLIGSILWLVAGRPEGVSQGGRYRQDSSRFPEYDRPGRHVAGNPDDDEEFLRKCRERAEQQRQQAKTRQREKDES